MVSAEFSQRVFQECPRPDTGGRKRCPGREGRYRAAEIHTKFPGQGRKVCILYFDFGVRIQPSTQA